MRSVRDGGVGASKRELESSADWHAALLDEFDVACSDVRYRHRAVDLTRQVIVHHASSPAARSTTSMTNTISVTTVTRTCPGGCVG